jgi:hypothetical protein
MDIPRGDSSSTSASVSAANASMEKAKRYKGVEEAEMYKGVVAPRPRACGGSGRASVCTLRPALRVYRLRSALASPIRAADRSQREGNGE